MFIFRLTGFRAFTVFTHTKKTARRPLELICVCSGFMHPNGRGGLGDDRRGLVTVGDILDAPGLRARRDIVLHAGNPAGSAARDPVCHARRQERLPLRTLPGTRR